MCPVGVSMDRIYAYYCLASVELTKSDILRMGTVWWINRYLNGLFHDGYYIEVGVHEVSVILFTFNKGHIA